MGIQAIFTKAVAMIADAWSKATILQKIQYVATAVTVAVGVKNFRAAKELAAKGQDILATKVTQGEKIPVIYGRRRIGSTVVFLDTADNRSKDLFVVYALSVGEVDQIEGLTIELDGNPITDTKRFRDGFYIGSDKISSGAGSLCTASQIGNINQTSSGISGTDPTKRYRQVFNLHHGSASQTADPMLTASISSKWTSSHKLNGIAYIAASFEFDSKAMFQGVPQLTVVVRGKKLYDPRKDTTYGGTGSHAFGTASTYEWSDNPSLCLLDYMTNDEYGKGLAAADINMTTFQDAADDCDSLVNTPDYNGTASSFTFSGAAGNNYISIASADYANFKGDGVLTVTDSGASTVIDESEIITTTRYSYYDSSVDDVKVYIKSTLGSSYTNETGTALVKVKRFTTNGVVDTNNNVLENTRDLLSNCRGIINYIEGKYELSIEDTASSAFSVTDDHIIAESGINLTYEDKSQKANKVVVEYFNALKGYELDTVTVFHNATPNYKSDDGGEELELKVSFPFIIDPYVAHNMGEAVLGRSRNQTTISFTATPELYKVKVGDVIDLTYTALGFSGKLFRIESMGLTPEGLVNVQAIEYLDIYTWTVPNAENVEGLVDLPQTHAVKAPTGLAFTDSNTSSTGRPFISWNEPTDFPNHEYRVNIVDSSSNQLLNKIVDVEFVDLNYLPVGSNYVASVTSINSIGSESDAATLTFSVATEPVATADVKDSAVTTGKINDSAVTSGKLADGAVTTLKLADDAVTNAKLAVDSIQGDVIAAGSITTTKLADDAVTNAKIAVDAIQGDVIAAGAITTTKLGANAVTTAKLATDAVTSDIIAASAVTTTEISDNAISTAKLIAGSVTTAKIATGAVTANEIAANTITAGEIAAGAVNTSELAANAVTAAKIAANTITASQIAAGTITANEIATDTITAANIAAGAINTSELAANAVTAAKIAANTITASQIAAGTITTTQIAAGTIAASNIATGTLTSASGVFGAISAGDISTGSLTSTNHSGTGDGSDFSTAGTKINIADGSVSSENFRISSAGDAFFRGQVTAGSGVSTVAIGADSGSNINIFAGATTPDSATFKVDSTGKVTLTSLILKTGGNTYFDENGFTDYAITQILQGTGTTVGSYAYSQSDNSAYATITTTDAVTVDLTASLDMSQILGDNSYSTSALAKAQIPEDITIIIEVAEDDNTFGSPLHGSTSSQFTADTTGVFQPDPSDGSGVTSSEYHVSAFGFFGVYTASISPTFGAVDGNSNMSVSLNNVSLSANTTYYFRFRLTTTDTNYDLENNLTIPTATRTLNISAQSGGFVVASGGGSGSGTSADSFQRISVSGQSTIIADATNSNNLTIAAGSGIALTTNASTDTLTIAASGSPTFTNLTVTGDLTVQGSTTTLETATLNVEDKNITLNYGSGDTSASANGAGITIQDAVNSTTDATILWNATSDKFDFSHGVNVTGELATTSTFNSGGSININASGTTSRYIQIGNGTTSNHFAYIDLIGDSTYTDYGLRLIRNDGGANTSSGLVHRGTGNLDITAVDSANLRLRTASLDRLVISSSGNFNFNSGNFTNVGTIASGAISTTGNLDVDGIIDNTRNNTSISAPNNSDHTAGTRIKFYDASSTAWYAMGIESNTMWFQSDSAYKWYEDAVERMTLSSGGNLSIDGTLTAGGFFQAGTSVSAGYYQDSSNGAYRAISGAGNKGYYFQSNAGGATYMYVGLNGTYAGRVGIGNSAPSEALHVTGNIYATGNVTATAFYGDGSNLTGVGGTTINSNADNRVITGSATANTLNAESGLTYDGSTLAVGGNITIANNSADPILTFTTTSSTADPVIQMNGNAGITAEGFEIWYDNSIGDVHLHTTYNNDAAAIRFHTKTGATKSTANERFTINGNGNINIVSGALQIGGTTVIDTSRNLTNIGTGDFAGNINIQSGTYEGNIGRHPVHTPYFGLWNQDQYENNSQKYMILNAGSDTYINGDTVYIRSGANSSSNQLFLDANGAHCSTYYSESGTLYYMDLNNVSSVKGLVIRGDQDSTGADNQLGFWGITSGIPQATSTIGFKQYAGNWSGHGVTAGGYSTFFAMDTNYRGWIFKRNTVGGSSTVGTNVASINNMGQAQFDGDVRSPVFYDNDNTAYYSNPNSTSNFSRLVLGGGAGGTYQGLSVSAIASSASPATFKSNNYSNIFSFLPWADGRTYLSSGVYYDNGSWVHASSNTYNCLLSISGLDGANWYASSNSTGSWNLASDVELWNNAGAWVNSVKSNGVLACSNFATGAMQNGALNIGRNDTDYRWDGTTWSSNVKLGILANCLDYWEFGIHDADESVESFVYYRSDTNTFDMGRDIGWGTTPIRAIDSVQSPTFYDYNDTNYYCNPASLSVQKTLRLNGGASGNTQGAALEIYDTGIWNGAFILTNGGTSGKSIAQFSTNSSFGQGAGRWLLYDVSSGNIMSADTSGLIVGGNVTAYGSVSDVRFKENIHTIDNALNKIMNLRGVTFDWKEESDARKITRIKEDIGFIAQEVKEVLPELVRQEDDGYFGIRDKSITAVLVEAMKEQQQQIELLKQEIANLKGEK